jgi:acyl dehydratase
MTAAAEASALESRVGHYYQVDDTYRVGREKVREYARAVQDYHPAHWDVAAAAELGYSGLLAPLTVTLAILDSSVEACLPTFHARAADRAHVAYMPDTAWPEKKRTPARLIPG